jgi:hypothetical protein
VCHGQQWPHDEVEWRRRMLIVQGGAVYLCFLDRIMGRGRAMRALILVLSILAIVDGAHVAKAGLSSMPRETLAPADTAIATDEATQETEDQIGLTKAKRREVQRGLTRLGFDTKVMGSSTNRLAPSSRAGRRSTAILRLASSTPRSTRY